MFVFSPNNTYPSPRTTFYSLLTFVHGLQPTLKLLHTLCLDFSKADLTGLSSFLMDTDFSCCFQSRDVELVWSVIKHSILTAMHKFIPKVKLRSHQRPKWFTPDIQHHLNCTRTLRRRHNTHPTPLTLQKLQHAEHILQEKMTMAKRAYEFNLVHTFASSNNSRIYK